MGFFQKRGGSDFVLGFSRGSGDTRGVPGTRYITSWARNYSTGPSRLGVCGLDAVGKRIAGAGSFFAEKSTDINNPLRRCKNYFSNLDDDDGAKWSSSNPARPSEA